VAKTIHQIPEHDRPREKLLAKGAAALTAILSAADRTDDMAPSRITQSRGQFAGEQLTAKTLPPVDRETSTPLADILFPTQLSAEAPLFGRPLTEAITALLGEWANVEALVAVGAPPPRSCLLFGDPGTGKTRLALWIARQLDLPIVLARLDSLVSSFLGTSARNIANLFAFSNRYQCLLLLDEFDAIAKLRDDPHEVGEIKRVVNALMQHLDARHSIGLTIGITNHPQLLDRAIWRRFEVQIEIAKPDREVRHAIIAQHMPPVDAPPAHIAMLAWMTEGASGAEVEALVRGYKKEIAVNPDGKRELLHMLRRFVTLNTGRITEVRKAALLGNEDKLLQTLRTDTQMSFEELGVIAGQDKSTISRRLKHSAKDVA
jgi:hypothetical protein